MLAAGTLVGLAAGFLLARAVYVGNSSGPRGPVAIGPSAGEEASMPAGGAMGSGPQAPGGADPSLDADQKAMHDVIMALLSRAQADPRDREARVRLGNITSDNGLYDMAAKFYDEALAIDGGDAAVLVDGAIAYRNVRDPERAVSYLERAVAVDPKLTKGWYNMAVVKFFDRGDAAGARAAVAKVLEQDPSFARVKELAARIGTGA